MQDLTYRETRDETLRRIAYLEEHDGGGDAGAGWTVHGVALAPETTHGAVNGEPQRVEWPVDVLERAAATLEGQPIVARHTDDDTGAIEYPPPQDLVEGKVTKAAYAPGVGVIYEATIADEDIARKVEAGVLEVSPEIPFDVEDPDADPLVASDAQFASLAIVSIGGGPSNEIEAGPSEALASLSAAGLSALLSASAQASGPDDPADPSDDGEGEVSDADADDTGTDADAETETDSQPTTPAESGADADPTQNMGDDPNSDDDPSVETLLERLDEREERIENLEENVDTLEDENEDLQSEVTEVKEAYAAALATADTPFTEEDLVESFDVATLRERFEDRFEDGFAATLSDQEPDVQSGADGGADDVDVDDATLEEARDLAGRAQQIESIDADHAATLREEAAETVGVDDFDAVLEVLD